MKCIAIDDEPLALDLLEDNISRIPYLQLAARCHNAFDALETIQQQSIDLIFLDIQMPGLTGLQLLQCVPNKPLVILITAYEKYALDGYNLDVTDYLVKPVAEERFAKACHKALQRHQVKTGNKPIREQPDFFFVNVEYSLVKIIFSDICWIEGLKDYVKIHLFSDQQPLITRMSIKSLEAQLPTAGFIRIHKSYMVAIAAITAIRRNCVFVAEQELPIGDTYRDILYMLAGKTNLL
ncbi:LytR/AlgR family response regulator transcription factor [Chitinophaga nivalis]|uniref:LytTR family DNA-binding domain-containing protein n=1 Tax=Chitinophaga nivalis TaxID=2991709 RepID=A0ABT3IGI3_9BACT|nr:LytTR family DNA-binding domain-containing protein [Chitinophaga nivalis]MCW3467260.1 LytTR family DNA-binding domain-containing protein [Chitinophaga nivalis]MCW3483048.1 LytTR family DNA-binding domain-containing protein [Chitinophaga nivalis]